MFVRTIVALALLLAPRAFALPFINEFHAENVGPILASTGQITGVEDVNNNATDWIELRNPDPATTSLAGWALSDDPADLGKWVFPSPTNITANGHLLVFASGKDRAVPGVQLHTNFKLGKSGVIILSQPNGSGGWNIRHQIGTAEAPYPDQKARFSYGYSGTSGPNGPIGYLEIQTPNGQNNVSVVSAFVEDTTFSVNRGFYDSPQSVTISTPTPGASLIYTLDGSEPTLTNGTVVPPLNASTPPSVTVNITTTTCVRARATKTTIPALGSTNIDTHTYIFPSHVLTQTTPAQASLNWGNPGPDWEMDPEVVNHANPDNRCVADDLKSIPTVSVVLDWRDLFGSGASPGSTGAIYPPAAGVAVDSVERRASFEYINPAASKANPNGKKGTQQTGRVEITGGTSVNRWNSHKLSMKFGFGPDLEYDLFGDSGAKSFDQVLLDGRYNNVWTYNGGSSPEQQRLRSDIWGDPFVAEMQIKTGGFAPRSNAVHLYLNGIYWGIYVLHERPDQNFAEAYLGGDSDEYDVIKHHLNTNDSLVAGKIINPAQGLSINNHTAGVNYQALLALSNADLTVQANYDALLAKLDLTHFAEYMLLNFYFGNTDWAHQNWYATYNRVRPDGKWRYHSWDAEHIMESATANVVGKDDAQGPTHIHRRLRNNPEYRLFFADVVHRRMFNNGLLTYPRIWNEFDARLQVFSEAMRAESARWGDNRAHLRPSPFTNVPYLRGVEWFNQRTWWQNTYFPTRSAASGSGSVITQLRNDTMYPTVAAPVFSQHGGSVPSNFGLTMTNPGGATSLIRYTLDGSDPRLPGGAVSPSALTYSGTITLTTSRTVKARVLSAGTWSALNEADFQVNVVPAAAGNLVISKIHYRPSSPTPAEIAAGFNDRSDFEFIELLNISTTDRVSLDDIDFSAGLDIAAIPGGVRELAPGERALYVSNLTAFEFRYGAGLPIAGIFALGSNLNNNGETVTLLAANDSTIVSVNYGTNAPWPSTPDGDGPSLVLMRPGTSDPTVGSNWRQSTTNHGSPGADDRLLFSAWQTTHFPGGTLDEPLDDPDGDSIVNLLEFGLGTDPNAPTPLTALPSASAQFISVTSEPELFLLYSIRHVKAAEELTWTAEYSDNLTDWSDTIFTAIPVGNPVDHGDGTETRFFRPADPLNAGGQSFFRSRVQFP